ncbi:MAG: hypothetical protein IH987_16210 [Planctomycetes bacterium]|nr:hypothetical protein [Planctomycetota bacterium]
MKLLRQISEDKVAVPTINRSVRFLLGGTALLGCAVLILIHELSIVHHPMAMLALTSLSAATAVACASWVSIVHVDRKSGVISRRWGFFFPGARINENIEAKAVALLTDQRSMDGMGQGLERHRVYIVERVGRSIIRETWCLETARRLSEELAEFLDVELLEETAPAAPSPA